MTVYIFLKPLLCMQNYPMLLAFMIGRWRLLSVGSMSNQQTIFQTHAKQDLEKPTKIKTQCHAIKSDSTYDFGVF